MFICRKALQRLGLLGSIDVEKSNSKSSIQKTVDMLRLLVRAQDDVTALDVAGFFKYYYGPPEGAMLVLSQDSILFEVHHARDGQVMFPPLAGALRNFARFPAWEGVVRFLIRQDIDLHAPVPRDEFSSMNALKVDQSFTSRYCTPLDDLFLWTESPFEGKEAGKGWLQILESEGYDVNAYLKEEMLQHGKESQFTFPSEGLSFFDNPHQLFFELGQRPRVWWDWWIDPTSPAYLVREEFRYTFIFESDWGLHSESWDSTWPFDYPAWHRGREPYGHEDKLKEWKRLHELSRARSGRRLKAKAAKQARIDGFKKQSRMPGAWPI